MNNQINRDHYLRHTFSLLSSHLMFRCSFKSQFIFHLILLTLSYFTHSLISLSQLVSHFLTIRINLNQFFFLFLINFSISPSFNFPSPNNSWFDFRRKLEPKQYDQLIKYNNQCKPINLKNQSNQINVLSFV